MSPWYVHRIESSLSRQDKVVWEMSVRLEQVFPEMILLCVIIVPVLFHQLPRVSAFSSGALLFGAPLASFACLPVSANKLLQLP